MATAAQIKFINEIAPIIVRVSRQYGYKVASTTIAQAICESGYGNAWSRRYNNYFGIKYGSWVKRTTIADKISVVQAKTKEEYKVGTLTTIIDGFCKCPDMETGVILYFEFLRVNPRYKNLKSCTTARQMAETLKADGYATSSTYVNTLMKYVNLHNLTQYDNASANVAQNITSEVKKVAQYAGIVNVSGGDADDTKNYQHYLNVRTAPSASSALLQCGGAPFRLPRGMVISIEQESNGFGKLTGVNGWVSLTYIKR